MKMSDRKVKNLFTRKFSKDSIKKEEILSDGNLCLNGSENLIPPASYAGNLKAKMKKDARKMSAQSYNFANKIKKNKHKGRNSMVEQLNGIYYDVSYGRVLGN